MIKSQNTKNNPVVSPELNQIPENFHHIHLMGICGTGMASLAGMLKEKGYHVTGSDQNIYPPMSNLLESLSIPVLESYDPCHLHPNPDLIVLGNVITRDNPEAVELSRLNLPYVSFPQALEHFALRGKQSIVVAGTHGKTTTSALVAWILEKAGMDPGFMIGGIPRNFQKNFKLGNGPCFVIEGDEYDTAFFDKQPKFLHYKPWLTILTSIEFDHADIYRDLDHVIGSFRKLIDSIPPEGTLIANGDDPIVNTEIDRAKCHLVRYGFSGNCTWRPVNIDVQEDLTRVTIQKDGIEHITLATRLYGRHNISNLLAAVALADLLEIDPSDMTEAVRTFGSVKRRQEKLGERNGIVVLDDFAHHPTAVRETIDAVKEKYRDRRLIAVFEPRSNSSRRKVFQERYALCFDSSDLAMIPEPPLMEKIPLAERFSSRRLVMDLEKRGLAALYFSDTDLLMEALVREACPGDVILMMSNGGFDNLPQRLFEKLPVCL